MWKADTADSHAGLKVRGPFGIMPSLPESIEKAPRLLAEIASSAIGHGKEKTERRGMPVSCCIDDGAPTILWLSEASFHVEKMQTALQNAVGCPFMGPLPIHSWGQLIVNANCSNPEVWPH